MIKLDKFTLERIKQLSLDLKNTMESRNKIDDDLRCLFSNLCDIIEQNNIGHTSKINQKNYNQSQSREIIKKIIGGDFTLPYIKLIDYVNTFVEELDSELSLKDF